MNKVLSDLGMTVAVEAQIRHHKMDLTKALMASVDMYDFFMAIISTYVSDINSYVLEPESMSEQDLFDNVHAIHSKVHELSAILEKGEEKLPSTYSLGGEFDINLTILAGIKAVSYNLIRCVKVDAEVKTLVYKLRGLLKVLAKVNTTYSEQGGSRLKL